MWCSAGEHCRSVTRVDFGEEDRPQQFTEKIQRAVESGGAVVVERVARESWAALWPAAKAVDGGGKILVSLDSWRRPSGQLEGEVLWVQLRHDREPLAIALSRALVRNLTSRGCPLPPQPVSLIYRGVQWIAAAWSRLSGTLMTLGFSAVLHGPYLFITHLIHANNFRDMLRYVHFNLYHTSFLIVWRITY